ncbi:hypothetical protein RRG08_033952 [Elysia crispata]|uniref:Uncharacterized protein n=1 Tax=Elysia crispata TaxID=231223 RepID=A0AAE1D3G4_9GAST|nr:hypothetical protein RRG08_033952 [Elysia crispata]
MSYGYFVGMVNFGLYCFFSHTTDPSHVGARLVENFHRSLIEDIKGRHIIKRSFTSPKLPKKSRGVEEFATAISSDLLPPCAYVVLPLARYPFSS